MARELLRVVRCTEHGWVRARDDECWRICSATNSYKHKLAQDTTRGYLVQAVPKDDSEGYLVQSDGYEVKWFEGLWTYGPHDLPAFPSRWVPGPRSHVVRCKRCDLVGAC